MPEGLTLVFGFAKALGLSGKVETHIAVLSDERNKSRQEEETLECPA